MAYTPTAWVNGAAPPINAVNLGKIEAQLLLLDQRDVGEVAPPPTGVEATDKANIQAKIDAVLAAGRGIVQLQPGEYIVNTGLSITPGAFVAIRGCGKGATGGWVGTRIKRTSGSTPIISATGTGPASNQRAICEISDMELSGGTGSAGDLLAVSRASHFTLRDVRVANNQGGIGAHLTEVWDSVLTNVWIERCGNGTTSPALLMDSVVGEGALADCATIQVSNITFQSNYGTDWKFTGSAADGSACNDIEAVNVKMEGTGTGTSGTPDTYPYIDLDYAQNCHFANVRISMPTGRGATFIQQVGTSAGPRANQFVNTVLDVAGSNAPARYIDQSVGTLVFNGVSWPAGAPSSEYMRIQSSVSGGRSRIANLSHNSANVTSGFITDARTTQEEQNKGRINIPIVSSDGTLTTIGDNAAWALIDAADQYVRGQVILPRDVDANGKAYIRVYWTASTTGNIQWSWWQRVVSAGGNLSTAGTPTDSVQASPGANLLAVTSWSGAAGIAATAGQLVTVKFGRKGTHANDTMTGTAYIVGIELYYDKRI